MRRDHGVLLLAILWVLLVAISSFADSNIRMVRLSFVQGDVSIDRNDGQGFSPAVINMPVTAGTIVSTGNDGLAEVEFEDGSTLNITGDTSVRFAPLSLAEKGLRMTAIGISQGTAYLHVKKTKHDSFSLQADGLTLNELPSNTDLRISIDSTQILVAVFRGHLTFQPEIALDNNTNLLLSTITIGNKESFRVDRKTKQITDVAKGIDPMITDAWDREREAYLKNPSLNPGLATASLAFAPVADYGCGDWAGGIIAGWNEYCWFDYTGYPGFYGYYPVQGVVIVHGPPRRPPRPHPGWPVRAHKTVILPRTVASLPQIGTRTALANAKGARWSTETGGAMARRPSGAANAAISSRGSARWVSLPSPNGGRPVGYATSGYAGASSGGVGTRSGAGAGISSGARGSSGRSSTTRSGGSSGGGGYSGGGYSGGASSMRSGGARR